MTKVVTLTDENFNETLNEAVEALRAGDLIVYPTDTAYALGADFTNKEALQKIFEVKGRIENKGVSSTYANLEMIKRFHPVSEELCEYIEKYLPGALTILIKDPAYKGKVGIRIPDNTFALKLAESLGKPVTATSANIAGEETPFSVETVIEQFGENHPHIAMIIDQGEYLEKQVSTVVELVDGEVEIKRIGKLEIS